MSIFSLISYVSRTSEETKGSIADNSSSRNDTAIGANKQIRFKYFDWNLEKKMEPRYDGRWYQLSPWALKYGLPKIEEEYFTCLQDGK